MKRYSSEIFTPNFASLANINGRMYKLAG
jgi:hypothetical protein